MSNYKKRTVTTHMKPIVAIGVTAALATGGALAYFTDYEFATNKFSVSDGVDITLAEPSWSTTDENNNGIPDAAENLVPLQTVAKDPFITNDSADSPCYVFMDVCVPLGDVELVNKTTGKVESVNNFELFSYEYDNQNWTLLKSYQGHDCMHHVYAYKQQLAVDAETTKLFNSVTLANLAEDSLRDIEKNQQVVVSAYGIQTAGFSTPEEAWTALDSQRNITA